MHLIIDGYNVMHALAVKREWPGKTFQDRRRGFLAKLNAYAAGRRDRITVVFDGTKGGDEMGGGETVGMIDARYSPRGVEADELIRNLVDAAPRPGELLVVTSDKPVASYARTRGAAVARSDELLHRLFSAAGAAPTAAADFERHVKGYEPPRPRGKGGRGPRSLW